MSVNPDQLEAYAQTAETAMDLLSALEATQLLAIERNDWTKLRMPSHELAILRHTYHALAELREWLKQKALEELEASGR